MTRGRPHPLIALVLALCLTLLSCGRPSMLVTGARVGRPAGLALRGRASFHRAAGPFTTQATMSDVGPNATVSMLDAASGQTLATTLTDGSGNFVLTLPNFTPATNSYVLEAVKGLNTNAANNDALRVRTLVQFVGGGWQSMTSNVPNGPVYIDTGTTAVCLITSLRGASSVGLQYVGGVSNEINVVNDAPTPNAFNPPGSLNISQADYSTVYGLIDQAFAANVDAFSVVAYDANNSRYLFAPHTAPTINPTNGSPGTVFTITGTGFSQVLANNIVRFNGVQATLTGPAYPSTTLTGTVPGGITSGPVTVQIGNLVYLGPLFSTGPAITGFSPGSGGIGASVTITGSGFSTTLASDTVKFNGTAATVTAASATSLTVTVPSGATTGTITVTVGGQTATSASSFTVTGGSVSATPGQSAFVGTPLPCSGTTATNDVLGYPSSSCVDSTGAVYAADGNSHIVYKISGGTWNLVAGNGTYGFSGDGGAATSAQLWGAKGVCVTSAGVFIADTGNNRIRMVCLTSGTYYGIAMTAGNIYTVAGNGTPAFLGDGGAATAAEINSPAAVAVDGSGNLYIVDSGNNRIRKVTSAGTISTFAGTGTAGHPASYPKANTSVLINNPSAITVDGSGNVLIADTSNHAIVMFCVVAGTYFGTAMTAGNGYVVAGTSGTSGASAEGVVAKGCKLNYPFDVKLTSNGSLVISDQNNYRVRLVAAAAGTYYGVTAGVANDIYTVAGTGTSGYNGDGIAGTAAQVATAQGLSVDSSGNLSIVDGNYRIRLLNSAGTISTIAGTGSNSYGGDGNLGSCAWAYGAIGVACDGAGNVYFVEQNSGKVRKVSAATGIVSTFAGTGVQASPGTGDGGPALNARFGTLEGVGADAAGNVYICDYQNGRIRMVPAANGTYFGLSGMVAGNVYTIAGGGASTADNVAATTAMLDYPEGVTTDAAGNLYIGLQGAPGDYRLRKVSPAGTITTVAGTGATGTSVEGVAATASPVGDVEGVTTDAAGDVIFVDYSNCRVRMIPASTGVYYGISMTAGNVYTIAGNGTTTYGGENITATTQGLANPWGVAVDGGGNVFVAADQGYRVYRIDTTDKITTVAGNGTAGNVPPQVYTVSGVCIDPTKTTVYVADFNGNRIWKLH